MKFIYLVSIDMSFLICSILRLFVGIVAGLVFIAAMPVYDAPFGGCEDYAFFEFAMGCSSWLDFIFGVGAVLIVALIGPSRFNSHIWGVGMVVVLVFLGGLSGMKAGSHIDVFVRPSSLFEYWRSSGASMVLGGALGALLFVFFSKFIRAMKDDGG